MSDADQLTQQVVADFAPVGAPQPGDAERLARLAAVARAAAARNKVSVLPRRRVPVRVLLIAAVVAVGGAAAARVWWGGRTPEPALSSPLPAAPLSLPPAPSAAPVTTTAPEVVEPTAAPPSVRSGDATAVETAESLFAKANAARRAGQAARAVSLYQQLQRTFPSAPEVQLSRVSLGRMLLDSKSAAAALGQFDRYLAASGGLRSEALYGRARALSMLGRSSEERSAWEQLLREYPQSVYAQSAKARLLELR
jgi:tetratricopeptide (TPR) repeat protein